MKRFFINFVIVAGCVFLGWYMKGNVGPSMPAGGGKQMPGMSGNVTVFSSKVKSLDVSQKNEYIGIVEPIKYVDLKPEISGNIEDILFVEGAMVKKGQVLFEIDPDKYIADVNLKKAQLEHEQANLSMMEKEYLRRHQLYKENHISQASIEQSEAELIQAKASEKQAIANLQLAQINLENSKIKAPISGLIGKALTTEGHYVTAGNSTLARIVQQNPIRVVFSVSDKEFLNGKIIGKEHLNLEIILPTGEILPEKLTSFFVDNQVDKDTATITIYAEFANKDNLLVAGNYVKVFIYETMDEPVVSVPAMAIGEDKYGSFVFIVAEDGTAKQVRVKTGDLIGANQVIESGLNVGESIIIEGLQKITNGKKINPQEVE